MRNFDRGRGGGGGRDFGRRDSGGSRFDRPREMTQVICSNCGKETEVPFKPSGDRPVYCRDCFAKMGGPAERRNDSRPSFGRREDRGQAPQSSAQLDEINSKLDQLIKLLTPSTGSEQAPKEEAKTDEQVVPEKKEVIVKSREARSGSARKRAAKKTPAPEAPEEV